MSLDNGFRMQDYGNDGVFCYHSMICAYSFTQIQQAQI